MEPTGPNHDEGMRVARKWAGWYLGSPSWADDIVNAYLNPASVDARLQEEIDAPLDRSKI